MPPFATFAMYEHNILVVTLTPGQANGHVTKEEMDFFFNGLVHFLDKGEPFSLIIDTSLVKMASTVFATRILDFMKKQKERFEHLTSAGTAIIVKSTVVKGLMDMVLMGASTRCAVVNSLDAARTFLTR